MPFSEMNQGHFVITATGYFTKHLPMASKLFTLTIVCFWKAELLLNMKDLILKTQSHLKMAGSNFFWFD